MTYWAHTMFILYFQMVSRRFCRLILWQQLFIIRAWSLARNINQVGFLLSSSCCFLFIFSAWHHITSPPHSAQTSQNSTQSEFFTQAGAKPEVNCSQNRSFLEIQKTKNIKYVYSIKKSTFTTEIRKYTLNQKCKLLHKIFFIDKIKIHDTMIEI